MELAYSLNTFYFLLSGVLVMWMGAVFTRVALGSVGSKNVIRIIKLMPKSDFGVFTV